MRASAPARITDFSHATCDAFYSEPEQNNESFSCMEIAIEQDIEYAAIIIIIIIIIIILLKQDYKIQLANNKLQMARLTCWQVVW